MSPLWGLDLSALRAPLQIAALTLGARCAGSLRAASVRLFVGLSISLIACLSVCLFVCLLVCLLACLVARLLASLFACCLLLYMIVGVRGQCVGQVSKLRDSMVVH